MRQEIPVKGCYPQRVDGGLITGVIRDRASIQERRVYQPSTRACQRRSMAKLPKSFLAFKLGQPDVSSGTATKNTPRSSNGGSYISVKLPGAGEVRLDLSRHIDKSLKHTSDVISRRYKLTGRDGQGNS
jgi:hypothetical protein